MHIVWFYNKHDIPEESLSADGRRCVHIRQPLRSPLTCGDRVFDTLGSCELVLSDHASYSEVLTLHGESLYYLPSCVVLIVSTQARLSSCRSA